MIDVIEKKYGTQTRWYFGKISDDTLIKSSTNMEELENWRNIVKDYAAKYGSDCKNVLQLDTGQVYNMDPIEPCRITANQIADGVYESHLVLFLDKEHKSSQDFNLCRCGSRYEAQVFAKQMYDKVKNGLKEIPCETRRGKKVRSIKAEFFNLLPVKKENHTQQAVLEISSFDGDLKNYFIKELRKKDVEISELKSELEIANTQVIRDHTICPVCGGELVVKYNRDSGQYFKGCIDWQCDEKAHRLHATFPVRAIDRKLMKLGYLEKIF